MLCFKPYTPFSSHFCIQSICHSTKLILLKPCLHWSFSCLETSHIHSVLVAKAELCRLPAKPCLPPSTQVRVQACVWTHREPELSFPIGFPLPSNITLLHLFRLISYPSDTTYSFPILYLCIPTHSFKELERYSRYSPPTKAQCILMVSFVLKPELVLSLTG